MDNRAVARRSQIDNLTDSGGILVTSDHESPRPNLTRITCLIEKRPQQAGVILIIQVSTDIHVVHLSPPLARSHS